VVIKTNKAIKYHLIVMVLAEYSSSWNLYGKLQGIINLPVAVSYKRNFVAVLPQQLNSNNFG